MIYDDTRCWLGEGPIWHPKRQQLYWFDIVGGHLHTREEGATRTWDLGENASAAGWVDDTSLLVATETRLLHLNVENGAREDVVPLEADREETRCNDGRADPWGGFWIGTMHKRTRTPDGTIYRYYRGELRPLMDGITIPNAMCFAPDRSTITFVDTIDNKIKKMPLDPTNGWPSAAPEDWLDLSGEAWGVDGAVQDADGNLWLARWNGWGMNCYAPDGTLLREVAIEAAHCSCPAFGGPDLTTLFCTTADGRVTDEDRARSDKHGMVHKFDDMPKGQAEHQVIL